MPKISQDKYELALNKAVDTVFDYAANTLNWDWNDLARKADLTYRTVHNLGSRVTRLPRWQTFWKLATACGLQMQFVNLKSQAVITAPKARLKIA